MKRYINFAYLFTEGFEESYLLQMPESAAVVDLPHTVKKLPTSYFSEEAYQGIYTYQKSFDLLEKEKDLPVHILHFEGAMLKIHVYLNGIDFGEHLSGYVPVDIDVSKAIKESGNKLTIVLDSKEDNSVPPFGKIVDYLTFGGIYRGIRLESHPRSYISNIFVHASKEGKIDIKTEIVGRLHPHFAIYDSYHLVKEFDEEATQIEDVVPWDIDNPHLYTLKASMDGEVSEVNFGCRDVEWKEDGFYLNGKKRKLFGLNRHQTYPYFGAAMPASMQKEDADILKEDLGLNIVRTSHYPNDESFLDECDRIGLLVLDEVPGWQYIGSDEKWRNNFYYLLEKMIIKERNHPSLVAYGTRIDESQDDDDLYVKAQQIQKKLDPYRASIGVRNFKGSHCLEDVYGYNEFNNSLEHGIDDPSQIKGAKGKPKLVTEYCGHMFPTKSYDTTDRRVFHALRHARVLNDAIKWDKLCGAIGWCAFDYNTHQDFGSGDHICHHGIMDMHRNPKLAYYVYASQFSKKPILEMSSLFLTGDINASLLDDQNYCFTNADFIELYVNGHFIKAFYPDKKNFPYLPHPPIHIDDYFGELLVNEGFSKKETKIMSKLLSKAGMVGPFNISPVEMLTLATIGKKHGLSIMDLFAIWNKYAGDNGRYLKYEVVAKKDGKQVGYKNLARSSNYHFELSCKHPHLYHGDSYDVARINVFELDEYGNKLPYCFDAVGVEARGPIEIISPKVFCLEGGSSAIYVRSLPVEKEEVASVHIKGSEAYFDLIVSKM